MRKTGFTLIEVMTIVLVIGIFFLVIANSFINLAKGVTSSRTRTCATTLAQEKIEWFKNKNYYRIMPTTQNDLINYGYDNTYYPPEDIKMGGIDYERRVVVRKVKEDVSGEIIELSPDEADSGIKKISVDVIWKEGTNQKSLQLSTYISNPYLREPKCMIYGVVTSTDNVPINQARVWVTENVNFEDYTDANGYYEIKLPSGTYQLTVRKLEYFESISPDVTVSDTSPKAEQNFSLQRKGTGEVKGYVFKRDRLLISEVCAAYERDEFHEYVELYNPTTYTITISDLNFKLKYVDSSNNIQNLSINWIQNSIPPNSYFLIASSGEIAGVVADAVYTPANVIASDDAGGVCITDQYDVWIDSVAWGDVPPPSAREGEGYFMISQLGNNCLERKPHPNLPAPSANGNAYDSNRNETDFTYHNLANPQNTSSAETPIGGTVVPLAHIYVDDGLSTTVIASSAPSPGYFYVTNVATGSWTLSASSYTLYGEVTVDVELDETIEQDIVLNMISYDGYITGIVKRADTLEILSDITVKAGIAEKKTDLMGRYRLAVGEGEYTIIANPDQLNPNFTTESTTVSVSIGEVVSGIDFFLYPGGKISGWVTTNGIDPLPNITIAAEDIYTGIITTEVSESDGYFIIENLKVSTYDVYPIVTSYESSNPSSVEVDVLSGQTVWSSTFTISGAFGTIRGNVKEGSKLITSGVLIIASKEEITGDPPVFDANLRSGTNIYYSTVSNAEGKYELRVIGDASNPYYIYGWYTKIQGDGTVTSKLSDSVTVPPGETKTVNFTW